MELSDLTAYALEKYHIEEEHKWPDLTGFSVLVNPDSGQWVALLMRQWDSETGENLECCDIKCGQTVLSRKHLPFLTQPFRMRGKKWVGVKVDRDTDTEYVCRLLDAALQTEKKPGATLVLEALKEDAGSSPVYQETLLPADPLGRDASPEEMYRELKGQYERSCMDGYVSPWIKQSCRQKLLEFSVLYDMPRAVVNECLDPEWAEQDEKLLILKASGAVPPEKVVSTLSHFAGGKEFSSPVLEKTEGEGARLFARVWEQGGEALFQKCFGDMVPRRRKPMLSPECYHKMSDAPRSYPLNPCRYFSFRDGSLYMYAYQELYFDRKKIKQFLHETDRLLRPYLKAGARLKEKEEEAWVTPLVSAVLAADRKEKEEAARPKVIIDFSGLDRIRKDAAVTRESLLTEEERGVEEPMAVSSTRPAEGMEALSLPPSVRPDETAEATAAGAADVTVRPAGQLFTDRLPESHGRILQAVLANRSVAAMIRELHGMPEMIADTINEAFYDEIGDNVVECDGEEIRLVEDYREEIIQCYES